MSMDDCSPAVDIAQLRLDVKTRLRWCVLEAIELILEEEVAQVLGVARHERNERRSGYRNGSIRRTITTSQGADTIRVPRARVVDAAGGTREFQSGLLPRYQRRTREVDEAILGCYLAGANTRRIRKALSPLLGEEHLSKSAISRVVGRLKGLFDQWRNRDLSSERYAVMFLDGFHLKVRLARRVISAPVLVALGVSEDGSKQVIAMELAVRESGDSWGGFVESLIGRGLRAPRLLVTDGHAGLKKARANWGEAISGDRPSFAVQRCTQHKWNNLKKACPNHAHGELHRDWTTVIGARNGEKARQAYEAMLRKWSTLCPPVARSLEEGGLELLTFYNCPKAMWKGIRSTNAIENLNREFRRRTKTQGSFSNEEAAMTLLFGLIAFHQIVLRKISGCKHIASWIHSTGTVPALAA